MYHPIPRDWLLATNKIEVTFRNKAQDRKSGHGSGFWICHGGQIVFVTNRHVIDIEYKDEKYRGLGYELSSVGILTFKTSGECGRQFVVHGKIHTHQDPRIDIALLRPSQVINSDGIPVTSVGVDIIADSSFLETELEWGAQISFSSFQPWRDTQTERPLLRTGILASDPAHPFVSTKTKRTHVHLVEAFSFAGSSGSPVFANAKGIQVGEGLTGGDFRPARIIGVMVGHLPNEEDMVDVPYHTHTGLSFCHRSDLLLAMVRGTESLQEASFHSGN